VAAAPASVQQALNGHEAMTYRAPNEGGGSRHEFPALLRHLLGRLVPSSGAAAGAPVTRAAPIETAQTVRRQLETVRQAHQQELEAARQAHQQELEAVRQAHQQALGAVQQALMQGDTEKANRLLSASNI
jgi:hypothetical protein